MKENRYMPFHLRMFKKKIKRLDKTMYGYRVEKETYSESS